MRDTDALGQPRHCRIFRDGARWLIEGLNSAGGTFVNGARAVGVRAIVHGGIVRCAASAVELGAPSSTAGCACSFVMSSALSAATA